MHCECCVGCLAAVAQGLHDGGSSAVQSGRHVPVPEEKSDCSMGSKGRRCSRLDSSGIGVCTPPPLGATSAGGDGSHGCTCLQALRSGAPAPPSHPLPAATQHTHMLPSPHPARAGDGAAGQCSCSFQHSSTGAITRCACPPSRPPEALRRRRAPNHARHVCWGGGVEAATVAEPPRRASLAHARPF